MDVTEEINGIITRIRYPPGDSPFPVILLLHGFTGDENSMWVFTHKLPENSLIIAPRGLYPLKSGGYSWLPPSSDREGWIDDYQTAMEVILEILTPKNFPGVTDNLFFVAGFSQGAALTYSIALTKPQRVKALAGLAGFMPQGAEALARNQPLTGRAAFIAHGTLDEIVPVERARKAVEILKLSGADVTYCEDEVTHKMSAECFKDFAAFFNFHSDRSDDH
jgi:phospholipase/carboxylesterase